MPSALISCERYGIDRLPNSLLGRLTVMFQYRNRNSRLFRSSQSIPGGCAVCDVVNVRTPPHDRAHLHRRRDVPLEHIHLVRQDRQLSPGLTRLVITAFSRTSVRSVFPRVEIEIIQHILVDLSFLFRRQSHETPQAVVDHVLIDQRSILQTEWHPQPLEVTQRRRSAWLVQS
jgi:hypothetical protein